MLLAFTISPMVASVMVFIAVTGMIAAIAMLFDSAGTTNVEERLEILAGKRNNSPQDTPKVTREALLKEGLGGLSSFAQQILDRFKNVKLFYMQADIQMKPETFGLIIIGCGILGLILAIVARLPLPLYPLVVIVMGLLPIGWLMYMRGRRFKKFAQQLPDAMELVARALRSGHSLASALKVVVDELPDPISKEFNIAYEEQNLGISLEQALKNLYTRMPNMDYKFFAMAVAIQRQSGGDLAEILDKIGHIIRERFRIMGQVQALTGEGRISGIVLMALPIVLFFAVWHLNPDYVMLLFTDDLGRKMVAGAVVLQILGAIAIKKIIAIKV